MKKLLFIPFFVLLFTCKFSVGQNSISNIPYYSNIDFNNKFSLLAESDDRSNFYIVDLSLFNAPFEIKFFEKLTFNDPKIVRIDSGNPGKAWFKSKKANSPSKIEALFLSFKAQSTEASATMTDAQKQAWLSTNGK